MALQRDGPCADDSNSKIMTPEKQAEFQQKLVYLVNQMKPTPEFAIGSFIAAALSIMEQVYRKPDGSEMSNEECRKMMIQEMIKSLPDVPEAANGEPNPTPPPPLNVVPLTPDDSADHLENLKRSARKDPDGAKPISQDDAMGIIEQGYEPPKPPEGAA